MTAERRVVVIAGAAGGLGTALSRRFAAAADTDVVVCDLDLEAVGLLGDELAAAGHPVDARRVDVTDADSVEAVVAAAVERHGRLDVMINNAGVLNESGRLHNLGDGAWERCFRVNLMGAVHGTASAARAMRGRGGGRIINTASVAGITPFPYAAPYSATKAAVIALTKVAALEYARDGIRVNAVCPGTFVSPIHAGLGREALDAMAAKHPLGLGTAEQVVGAYVYLASEDASWTTGDCMVVDGGYATP